ncbi:MAG: type IVB secretion system protein IcmV [Gammaproteobacteria bacterium]
MGKKRIRKAVVSRAQAWTSYEQTKKTTKSLKDFILRFFVPQRSRRQEDLGQAMQRLGLSAQDIKDRTRAFKRLTITMLLVAVGVFLYSVRLFMLQHWLVACVSLLFVGLPLAIAFRYHFWYFQLKKGKLGCSLNEWLREGILRRKQ